MDILVICNKLSNKDIKINIKYFFWIEKEIKDLNIDNYFTDVTYKIVLKLHLGYKLLIIIGVDKNIGNSYICALILIRYEDENFFKYTFKYLNNIYGFNPRIILIDYACALKKPLLNNEIIINPPIIVICFFLFYASDSEKT